MLIIFDCDGVLVDSERLASEIFSDCLAQIEISMTAQACFDQFHGKTLSACYEWIEREFNQTLPKNFHPDLERETRDRFAKELKVVDGVESLINSLAEKGVSYCVASNGGHQKILNSLTTTNLIHKFPHRFSAEDVEEGKPKPDLFLFAANALGFSPRETIVVEDSFSGVSAAKAAQMRVIHYSQEDNEFNSQLDAHFYAHSMLEVKAYIEKYIA